MVHPSCKWLPCICAVYSSCALLCSCRHYHISCTVYIVYVERMVPATIEMTLAVLFRHTVRGVFIYYLFIFTVLGMLHKYSITEPHTPNPVLFFYYCVFLTVSNLSVQLYHDYRFRKKQVLFRVWSRSWRCPSTGWILKTELRSWGLATSACTRRTFPPALLSEVCLGPGEAQSESVCFTSNRTWVQGPEKLWCVCNQNALYTCTKFSKNDKSF